MYVIEFFFVSSLELGCGALGFVCVKCFVLLYNSFLRFLSLLKQTTKQLPHPPPKRCPPSVKPNCSSREK